VDRKVASPIDYIAIGAAMLTGRERLFPVVAKDNSQCEMPRIVAHSSIDLLPGWQELDSSVSFTETSLGAFITKRFSLGLSC